MAALALSAIASQVSARLLPAVFPGGAGLQLAFALAGALVFGLILWAVGAGLLRLLAGAGSRAWEVYGWAWAPVLVLTLVSLSLAALMPVTGDLPPPPALTDAKALQQWQQEYQEVIAAAPVTRVQQGLSLVAALWSLWIVYSGLRVLAPARALLATGVVAALSLGLLAWSLR